MTHDAGHLHGMPTGTFPHDVTVERVQDTLVCQLQGVVEHRLGVGSFDFARVALEGTECSIGRGGQSVALVEGDGV